MAKKDNIKLLGKRVGYWGQEYRDDNDELVVSSQYYEGLVVAVVVPMEGYEAMAGNDVLLLQDGKDEPDFVSGEYDFDLLD
jgi:hypothetical protein